MIKSKDYKKNEGNGVKEEQYISKVLDNLRTNDLKSFKDYYDFT